MTTAKTTSERVDKLRKDRAALGLKRLELYAHQEDVPAIKALAEKLQRQRAWRKIKNSNDHLRQALPPPA